MFWGSSCSCLTRVMVFQGFPFPNAPFRSLSSVPSSLASQTVQGSSQGSVTPQVILGKRREVPEPSTTLSEGRLKKRQKQGDARDDTEAFLIDGTNNHALPSPNQSPWHHNDRYVRKFNQNELMAYIRDSQAVSSEGDDCPIHPIFRDLSNLAAQIPCLASALQLATRFLVCRYTLPFFHQLMTYNLDILIPESQYYCRTFNHLPPSPYAESGLPRIEHNLTLRAMIAMAPHIAIEFSDGSKISDKWAYTVRKQELRHSIDNSARNISSPLQNPSSDTSLPFTGLLAQLGFQGTNTEIKLSSHFLRVSHPETDPTSVSAQQLRATFFLAVTLVHELAHAVYMLRFPPGLHHLFPPSQNLFSMGNQHLVSEDYEPFYSTQFLPELGHAWESSIFRSLSSASSIPTPTYERGGIISSLANSPAFDIGLAWSRWPSSDSALFIPNFRAQQNPHYRPIPLSRLTRHTRSGAICPRPTPRWRTIYPLPDSWIAQFFWKEFWDEINVVHPPSPSFFTTKATLTGSPNAARQLSRFTPPRKFGVRCANNEWNVDNEYDPSAADMGVEANWGLGDEGSSLNRGDDENGVVRTGQTFQWEMWKDDEMETEEDTSDDDSATTI